MSSDTKVTDKQEIMHLDGFLAFNNISIVLVTDLLTTKFTNLIGS